MKFTKMEGLGNDYIYLNCMEKAPRDLPALAVQMSDRHFGVGSDGLICICPSRTADFQMRMYNADGSEGAMCGNGIRCVGKFVYDKGLTDKCEIDVETKSGVKHLKLLVEKKRVTAATEDMGVPTWDSPRKIVVKGKTYTVTPVSVGNPHIVLYVDDVARLDLSAIGPYFENHQSFPGRVNTEFVQVLDRTHLKMRVWERGSGETLACGTGASAVLTASVLCGASERDATIHLLGGDLSIRWDEQDDHIYMTGPAVTVFEGEWPDTTH